MASLRYPARGAGRRRGRPAARPLLAAAFALVAALSAAGCVSLPSAGPVQSFPVTQGPDAPGQPYQQVVFGSPGENWSPTQIVQGFLAASASFGDNWQVAREYMTPQASRAWRPSWSATVYSDGPHVQRPVYKVAPSPKPTAATPTAATAKKEPRPRPAATQASVLITGSVLASLASYGSYAVPSSSAAKGARAAEPTIRLVSLGGQWRISSPPLELLLTSDSFRRDYQLRNLYFFDPTSRFLIPDPVYVPLQATLADLINGLVHDLVTPPRDWLSGGATLTAFPPGTRIEPVALAGVTAVVNLGGPITRSAEQVLQQVSAQLLYTLTGSGQDDQRVGSVEVERNGEPWIPAANSQGNPVQRESGSEYGPPSGASPTFYYLDDAGDVMSSPSPRGPLAMVQHVGLGFSQVAVSPDGKYLALIRRDGDLYTAPVGRALTKRSGSQYTTMSWDPGDDLWATMNGQIVMLRGAASQAQPTPVSVVSSNGSGTPPAQPFTAVRVAPDGVRIAIIIDGTELSFGAISQQEEEAASHGRTILQIALSPVAALTRSGTTFTSLTWYGPDNVITLTGPGTAVTEYPVNGGPATSISAIAQMRSISASPGRPLLAGLANNRMMSDGSLTGSWVPIAATGLSPAYPG